MYAYNLGLVLPQQHKVAFGSYHLVFVTSNHSLALGFHCLVLSLYNVRGGTNMQRIGTE